MTKMFCVHTGELKPGVSEEEFRKSMVEEVIPWQADHNIDAYLVKGDKGERAGKYALILVTDVATRNAVGGTPENDPPVGGITEEMKRLTQKTASMVDAVFTDYVVEFSSK